MQKEDTKPGPGKARMNTRQIATLQNAVVSILLILVSTLYFFVPSSGSAKEGAVPNDSAIGAVGVPVGRGTLPERIKRYVRQLEYSDQVADDFIKLVNGWKNEKNTPALRAWQQALEEAKQKCAKGEITQANLARAEEIVIQELGQKIRKEFAHNDEAFELASALSTQQAQCVSRSMMVYILGNSLGLLVEGVDVDLKELKGALRTRIADRGDAIENRWHVATLVHLSNTTIVIVDAALGVISRPFTFEEEYGQVGNYWELKNKMNPTLVHGRIRTRSLLSCLYWNRAEVHVNLNQYAQAISDCTKAIELDPKDALAYYNRGIAYAGLRQHAQGVPDFTKAIELDPQFVVAYYNRAVCYWTLNRLDDAKREFLQALELNQDEKIKGQIGANIKLLDDALSKPLTQVIKLAPSQLSVKEVETSSSRTNIDVVRRDRHALSIPELKAAATEGNREAQGKLAELYYTGKGGVSTNVAEAYRWAFIASSSGDKQAKYLLAQIELYISPDDKTAGKALVESYLAEQKQKGTR